MSSEDMSNIRERAEQVYRGEEVEPEVNDLSDARHLIEELRIHQIELELQNEELKDLQNRLEATSARFSDLYHYAPVAYLTVDRDARIIQVNLTASKLFGAERGRLIDSRLVTSIIPMHRDTLLAHLRTVVDERKDAQCEVEFHFHGGRTIHAQLASTPEQTDDGEVYCRTVVMDITKRKQAEEALRLDEARYRLLIGTAREGYWRINHEGKTVEVNHALHSMLNMQRNDMSGVSPEKFLKARNHDQAERKVFLGTALISAEIYPSSYEAVLKGPDSEQRIVLVSEATYLDPGSQQWEAFAFIADLTESKKLEQKLVQAQKLESLSVLAGGVAHDFNNVLATIMGNAGLAMMDLDRNSPVRSSLEMVVKASEKGAKVTQQMLAYSGSKRLVKQTLNLNKLIQDLSALALTSISREAELSFSFDDDLRPIDADSSQMRQILMNLILNASESLQDGKGDIEVRTRMLHLQRGLEAEQSLGLELQPGEYVAVEVEDNGVGIKQEDRRRIFEPFYSTKFTGRGLGLAATLGMVRSHGGAIQVLGEPDGGSVFRIYLPPSLAALEHPVPAETPKETPQGEGGILLIEDEHTVLKISKLMLERAGYTVFPAGNGALGLELFEAHQDNLRAVILNLSLPEKSGADVFRVIKEKAPGLPVLLSSGFPRQEAIARFHEEGVAGFIQKPYKPSDLVRKLHQVLNP